MKMIYAAAAITKIVFFSRLRQSNQRQARIISGLMSDGLGAEWKMVPIGRTDKRTQLNLTDTDQSARIKKTWSVFALNGEGEHIYRDWSISMDSLLKKENELEFRVTDTFSGKMLSPILMNTLYKAETAWDDYDEVFHCCQLIEAVRRNPKMTMEFHYMTLKQQLAGIGLVSFGAIDKSLFFPAGFNPPEALERILIFNYFHISPEGRGNGAHWLRDIILPNYREKDYEVLYVKSSHPKVFSLYGRLGLQVREYSCKSDNSLYVRQGKIFKIPLGS